MSRAHENRLAGLALASALSASTVLGQATAPRVSTAPVGESPELATFGALLIRNLKATFVRFKHRLNDVVAGATIGITLLWI